MRSQDHAPHTRAVTSGQPAEFCELCHEPNPIDHDAEPVTGLWVCVECVENTLQGACYE